MLAMRFTIYFVKIKMSMLLPKKVMCANCVLIYKYLNFTFLRRKTVPIVFLEA